MAGAACFPPPADLISWWPADGSAADIVGTNSGTLQGGATASATGFSGSAFSFDGTNGYVQIADSLSLRPTNLTIECWVRFASLNSAGLGGSPAGDQYLVFRQNTRSGTFEGFDLSKTRVGSTDVFRYLTTSAAGESVEIASSTVISTGVWYHVAAARGSNFVQLFVNGAMEAQASITFPQDYGDFPLYFGTSGQSYWDHKLKGNLDEVSIYNRALTSAEIAAIAAAGSAAKCKTPAITTQPTNQTVTVGATAQFQSGASGLPTLGYHWYFNGAALANDGRIAGSASAALSIGSVQTNDAGNYWLVASNSIGSATSSVAVLTILVPPTITTQPVSRTNVMGTTATFGALAAGSQPLQYQWQLNGTNISGATDTNLTLLSVQASNAGNYRLTVTNVTGSATSAVAALTVLLQPIIVNQPTNQTTLLGLANTNVTFAVTASGGALLGYRWRKEGVNLNNGGRLDGVNADTLAISGVQTNDAGNYDVVVTNAAGAVTSSVASLTVVMPPTIGQGPQNQTKTQGSNALFTVTANGSPSFVYQWYFTNAPMSDNGRITGSLSSALTITALVTNDAGNYSVAVSNLAGSATSGVGTLTVIVPPSLLTQPTNQSVFLNSNVTFAVAATGTAPLAYHWRLGGIDLTDNARITGVTNTALAISGALMADAGAYSVVVTNLAGVITSAVASLTVTAVPPTITAQPISRTNLVGTLASFSASASGSTPLQYQWRINGTNLAGATLASLTLGSVQTSDAGGYSLLVTNPGGAATSAVAVLTVIVPPCAAVISNVVSWWQAENSTTDIMARNHGTVAGTGTFGYTTGKVGQAFVFDGIHRDRVDLGNPQTLQLQDFTLEAWIKRSNTNDVSLDDSNADGSEVGEGATIIGYGRGGYGMGLLNNGRLYLSRLDVDGITSTNLVADLNWHHVAVTKSGTTLMLYVDGSLALAPSFYSSTFSFDTSAAIGSRGDARGGTFLGMVDEPAIFSRALSGAEVQAIYTAGFNGKCPPAPEPAVTVQPVSQRVVTGQPITLTSGATGASLRYQWQRNGADVPGATNATLSISAIGPGNLGTYHLVASNTFGVAVSADATLAPGNIVVWGRNDMGQAVVPLSATNVVMISAGGDGTSPSHTLALRADGTVIAWGFNLSGQCNVPPSLSNVVAVAAGAAHSLALRSDGLVIGWGDNSSSQTSIPASLSNVIAIAAGASHSAARRVDGQVIAWGKNGASTNVPISVVKAVAIAAGITNNLALRADGVLVGWPAATNGLTDALAIAVGGAHDLMLRPDSSVLAWGANTFGQINTPAALTNATGIAAGDFYSLALRADGLVAAWGRNDFGQTNVPAWVSNTVAIAAGGAHGVALLGDGTPLITRQPVGGTSFVGRDFSFSAGAAGFTPLYFRWKLNGTFVSGATNASLTISNLNLSSGGSYQLTVSNATGVSVSVPAPLNVLNVSNLTVISQPVPIQTNYQGTKVILSASVVGNGPLVYQWVLNGAPVAGATSADLFFDPILATNTGNYTVSISNLSTSLSTSISTQQVLVAKVWGLVPLDPPFTLTNAIAVAAGHANPGHHLALRSDGKIAGWGTNSAGEAAAPATLSDSIAIAAGYQLSLALRSDGTVFTWGNNTYGQTNAPSSATGVVAIACGDYFSVALRSNGTVVAWGRDNANQTDVPPSLANVVAISSGGDHSLALRADGSVVSWGYNGFGQTNVPASAINVIAVAAGGLHSVVLKADGTVVQWGNSAAGTVPPGLSNVAAISAGYLHTTAVKEDGSVVSWGTYEQVGPLPVPSDLANLIQVSGGGDRDVGLFGTRAPALTVHPFSRSVLGGSNTVFIAKATGFQPVTYQWKFNGADIPGATNTALPLSGIQTGQTGLYHLVASNRYGVAASKAASLTIAPPGPAITLQPVSQTTNAGVTVQFQVTATGLAPLTYQWRKNTTNFPAATNFILMLTNVNRSNSGAYSVIVSNISGSVLSSNAVLKVLVPQKFGPPIHLSNGAIAFISTDADGGALGAGDLPGFTALASTNLATWLPISNALSITNGWLLLRDPQQTNYRSRFYRILEQ